MEIKYCCDEMKENIKWSFIDNNIENKAEISVSDEWDIKLEINYCPWCGKRIEFIDKASLGYAGDQNSPIKIVYTVDGEEHICSPS